MNKRILTIFAAALAFSAPAWGQPSGANQPRGVPTPGPGARGGWGPGMMGGYGPGMMGGYGPGMMGGYWGERMPDLTADQRSKVTAIQRELRNKQFALMDRMHDQWESMHAWRGGKFDEQAARKAYDDTEKLHRQMFENMLDAQKRIDALLTPQQRQQMERSGR